jgi:hypothetical protein
MSVYNESAIALVQDNLGDVIYNLSYTLQDYEGKVTDGDAHFILKNLQISPMGDVLSSISNPSHVGDGILSQDIFTPLVSNRASNVFYQISNFDTSVIHKPDYEVDKSTSILFTQGDLLNAECESMMSYLYIELYSVYTSLVEYQQGNTFPMSMPELDMLLSNLRSISTSIENLGDDLFICDLISVLRYMQRAILLVKYYIPKIVR